MKKAILINDLIAEPDGVTTPIVHIDAKEYQTMNFKF